MKKLLSSIVAGSALLFTLLSASPAFANHLWVITGVSCNPSAHTITISGTDQLSSDVRSDVYVNGVILGNFFGGGGVNGPVVYQVINAAFVEGAVIYVSNSGGLVLTSASTECTNVLNFTDGRCNQEPWQSVAVYPDNKGGYNFYALFNGVGYFAMHVTEQNLDDVPDTGITHKIAEAKGAQLFRLAGGGLRVDRMGKDNKMYSFTIGTCGAMED